MGVRDDGRRTILALTVTGREDGPDDNLFRGLRARGLRGVRLVLSDDHTACTQRSSGTSPGRRGRAARCTSSATSQLASPASYRAALMADVRVAFHPLTADMTRCLAFQVAERWRASHPKVAELFEDSIGTCLNEYARRPTTGRASGPPTP